MYRPGSVRPGIFKWSFCMKSTTAPLWGEKPYNSLDFHLKKQFGEKIYKLTLNAGCTCPNRDGTLGTGGCIF